MMQIQLCVSLVGPCNHLQCKIAQRWRLQERANVMQLMAEESGMSVDMEGFEACMAGQRERSRAAGKAGTGPSLKFEAEATAHLQRSGVPLTDDSPKSVPCCPQERASCIP